MKTTIGRMLRNIRNEFLSHGSTRNARRQRQSWPGRRWLFAEGLEDRSLLASDLSITLADAPDPVTAGGFLTYTLVAKNEGPDLAVASIVDNLPDGALDDLSAVAYTSVATGRATGNTLIGVGDINDLAVSMPAGSTVTYTITAQVDADASASISNTATISAAVGTDDNTANNSASATTSLSADKVDLQIFKTTGTASVDAGGTVTYSIVVTNAGPSDVENAVVLDTFASVLTGVEFTAIGAGGAADFDASGSGSINDEVDLPVGATIIYTVTGNLSASATGTLTNEASIAVPSGVTDINPLNNVAVDVDAILGTLGTSADLQITKTSDATSVAAGGEVTYTIVVTNPATSASVTGATVVDLFASLSDVEFTAVGTGGASNFDTSGSGPIIDVVNLPAGATITYTATGRVNPLLTGTLTNAASVIAPVGVADTNVSNNIDVEIDAVTAAQADLQIVKTSGTTSVDAGGQVSYAIVVSNTGPSDIVDARVTDTFAGSLSGMTFTAVGTGGASGFANGSGNLNQTVDLPVGSTITYTVTGNLAASATGSLSNMATVTAPAGALDINLANNTSVDVDAVVSTPTATADLQIFKTDAVSTVQAGGTVTYTIVVANTGSTTVTDATVTDDFAASLTGVTYTAVQTGGATGFTASGSGDINDTVTLPAGATITYTVTGTLDASATGTLSNTATVTAPAGVIDLNAANNVAVDIDAIGDVAATADLAITKTSGTTSVDAGGQVSYVIVVSNVGTTPVLDATVTDDFSASLTGVTFTAVGTGGASGFASGSGDLNQTVDLPVGSTITYTVTGNLSASATGSLSNTAAVTAPEGIAEANASNNISVDVDAVISTPTATADLQIYKTDAVSTLAADGIATYTIVVTNAGPNDVTGAVVSDTFDDAFGSVTFTAVGTTGTAGFTASGSGDISDTVTIPAGGSITYTVTADLSASATGTVSNTATVTAPAGVIDLNAANNVSVDIDTIGTVTATTDLQITKTNNATSVQAGDEVSYTIVVSNIGSTPVNGVVVADDFSSLLSGVEFTAAVTSGTASGYANGSGDLNQTINLGANSSVTYTVTGTLSAAATGSLINTATVTAPLGVGDTVPTNNIATDIDTIEEAAILEDCEIVVDQEPGEPGTAELNGDVLIVTGTSKSDSISIIESSSEIRVKIKGKTVGEFDVSEVGSIVVFGGAGNDKISVDSDLDVDATLLGEEGNDWLTGGDGDDQLDGGPGNDRLRGGDGDDILCGDDGNDSISGGNGNDTIGGEAGNDRLSGDAGNDVIAGGLGNDSLSGGNGDDVLFGQEGNDRLSGGSGVDITLGGEGNDLVNGGSGLDLLIGGEGKDKLRGDSSDDLMIGGSTNVDAHVDALLNIMASWASGAAYLDRIDELLEEALDENSLLDDGDKDELFGSSGQDWFLLGDGDKAKDKSKSEVFN